MMKLPDKKDAVHKVWLYRLLSTIADDQHLAHDFYFKGGTCAAMLGWLPRFSVDLDFDYAGGIEDTAIQETRLRLESVFKDVGLTIQDQSKKGIQYFLKYNSGANAGGNIAGARLERNTLKIDASFPLFTSSKYSQQRFIEIDRVLTCQTRETMFAHKLVTPLDRFEKTGSVAGRDIFDIHHFFLSGCAYDAAVIEERRGVSAKKYLSQLSDFIDKHVTELVITEDLSFLLPHDEFSRIRKVLKKETLSLLSDVTPSI